jgi:hypothetical protein
MKFPLHISISNQSLEHPISEINIEIDGKQIFQKQMRTGSQHNWQEVEGLFVSGGGHSLRISETSINISRTEELNVNRELWIVVTFHDPDIGLSVDILDHAIGFM